MKKAEKYLSELKEAIDWIQGDIKITEKIRSCITRALHAEIEKTSDLVEKLVYEERQGTAWTRPEMDMLKEFLKDKYPQDHSQEADIVNTISLRLRRQPKSVRKKATELGLGKHVDYWINR